MRIFSILLLIFILGCDDNFQEIKNINSKDSFPVGETENLKLIYTDSAKVKAILYSSLNLDFTNQVFPYSEFPKGVEITFFDKENNQTRYSGKKITTYLLILKQNKYKIFDWDLENTIDNEVKMICKNAFTKYFKQYKPLILFVKSVILKFSTKLQLRNFLTRNNEFFLFKQLLLESYHKSILGFSNFIL